MTGHGDDVDSGTATARPAGLDPIGDCLDTIRDALALVVDVRAVSLTDPVLQNRLAQVLEVRAGVEELTARLAGSIQDRDLPRLSGAASARAWLISMHGLSKQDATRLLAETRVQDAAHDGRTQPVRRAWASGQVSAERAALIAKTVAAVSDDIPMSATDSLQSDLVGHSPAVTYEQLKHLCRHAFEVIDPDAADRLLEEQLEAEETRALQKTRFSMGRVGDGTTRGSFQIPDLAADKLRAALDAYTAPRHRARANPDADKNPYLPVENPDGSDRWTLEQRQGWAFCQILHTLSTDRLPHHGTGNATIVITMSLDQLRSGLGGATLDTGSVISTSRARWLACNALLIPAVLDGDSVPLDLGRAQRLFSRHQKTALALRDKGCIFPSCERPPKWCESHHIVAWQDLGPTDLTNGCLVCPYHHHLVHQGEWTIAIAPDGIPEIIPPKRIDPLQQPRRHQRFEHPALC